MESNWRWTWGAALAFALLGLGGLPVHGQNDAPGDLGDDYRPGNFGRVRFEENGLTIVRAETDTTREFLAAGRVNMPIFPGDALATGPNQRAEAQLADSSVIRVDQHSHVVFASLPDPQPKTPDETILQLAQGGLRLEAASGTQGEFRLETPGCRILLGGGSELRVAVRGGRTRIAARRGKALVESGGGALTLRAGMATEVIGGAPPIGARPYNSFLADDFDRWVSARQADSAAEFQLTPLATSIYEALPDPVRPFFRELSLHGNWIRNDTVGFAWLPQVTDEGWRPYRQGHWGYGRRGYFWISHEPWGWAPYHYGRWIWFEDVGWGWVPGNLFAGAWVAWSRGAGYVGWCALDYWNLPARRSLASGSLFDPSTWTLVTYENFARPDAVEFNVSAARMRELESAKLVRRPPVVSPRQLAEPENLARAAAVAEEPVARDGSVSRGQPTPAPRSFLEWERQVASLQGTAWQSSTAATAPSEPGDSPDAATREQEQSSATATGRLEEPGGASAVRGQPTMMRPLVRFDQAGAAGTTERWKTIYRNMSRPRPTQTQTTPVPAVGLSEVEEPPAVQPTSPAKSARPSAEKKRGERGSRGR